MNVDYNYGSSFFLSNSADELILTDASANEIDRVEWDGGPNFPDPTGASMELTDLAADNNVGSNWAEATQSYGDGDLGTPGSPNGVAPTPTPTPTPTPSSVRIEAESMTLTDLAISSPSWASGGQIVSKHRTDNYREAGTHGILPHG